MVLMLQKRERREGGRRGVGAMRREWRDWAQAQFPPRPPYLLPLLPVRSRGREEGREEVCLNSGESGSRRGGHTCKSQQGKRAQERSCWIITCSLTHERTSTCKQFIKLW